MKRFVFSCLVGTLLVVGCSGAERADAEKLEKQATSESRREGLEVKLIDKGTLQRVVNEDGVVAIVRVTKAEVMRAGTRAESVSIDVEVKQRIHGNLPDVVEIRRYTSNSDIVLQVGRHYAVALEEVTRYAPALQLSGFVPVADDVIDSSAEAHRVAIEKLLR